MPSRKFDGVTLDRLQVSPEEMRISATLDKPLYDSTYCSLLHDYDDTDSFCAYTVENIIRDKNYTSEDDEDCGSPQTPGSEKYSAEPFYFELFDGLRFSHLKEIEQGIVNRFFALGDRTASELMTHRSSLICLDIHASISTIKQKVSTEIHSVYPVGDGALDTLLGIVSVKDLFAKK